MNQGHMNHMLDIVHFKFINKDITKIPMYNIRYD